MQSFLKRTTTRLLAGLGSKSSQWYIGADDLCELPAKVRSKGSAGHNALQGTPLDVDDNFRVMGLRVCSAWFHMEWVRKRGSAATLALAFGA